MTTLALFPTRSLMICPEDWFWSIIFLNPPFSSGAMGLETSIKFKDMKPFYILLFFFYSTTMMNAQENFVIIDGSTNVNRFQFVNSKFKNDNGAYFFSEKNLPNIILKVSDFYCANKMMTQDFQKILNSEKYPEMTIRFISLKKDQNILFALVEVKMMNKSRRYNVQFEMENNNLKGRKNVKFSDFNIIPPKKMGGMIVVRDDLNLTFSFATKS